jgi:LysM repeat protein
LKVAKHKLVKQQGSSTVTREHKLALIVGFSLILLVGVLISDHLSSARQAQVGGFGPGDFRIAEAPLLVPTDPLQRQDPSARPGWDAAPHAPRASGDDGVPMLPSPVGVISSTGAGDASRMPEPPAPKWIDQSRRGDDDFRREIADRGGMIRRVGGIDEIVLPPAVKPQTLPAVPRSSQAPEQEFEWYTVKPGERLFKIAEAHLGNGNRWREIQSLNSDHIDPSGNVRSGVRIRIPKQTAAPAARPVTPPPAAAPPARAQAPVIRTVAMPAAKTTTYTVQRGDTLGVISQKTLGTARRWREIAELNNIDDEDHVPAGKVLKIPAR